MAPYLALMLALVGLTATSATTATAQCVAEAAPSKFRFKEAGADKRLPGNAGIIPKGFVGLRDETPIVHGVDVSKWQEAVDFGRVRDCGGKFAYIRLSTGVDPNKELKYRSLWIAARSYNLLVGGYHNLTVIEPTTPFSLLSTAEQDSFWRRNVDAARAQSDLYSWRLKELLRFDRLSTDNQQYLGQPFLPIALDVSFRPQLRFSAADQKAFGAVYRAAICSWIDGILAQPSFKGQQIVLATTAFIYHDYELAAAPCDLTKFPIWISLYNRTGDDTFDEDTLEAQGAIRELCGIDDSKSRLAGSRCRLHHYTSFGGFAAFQASAELDLNRFYGTEDVLKSLLQRAKPDK